MEGLCARWLEEEGTTVGLTEDERRVGLLEAGEVPKVGRLTELVALTSWECRALVNGMRMNVGELDSQDSFTGGKEGFAPPCEPIDEGPQMGGAHLHSCI